METTTETKEIILDYSKWRCGDDGPNKLGEGRTLMANGEGFQCCLGQATLQLIPDLKVEDILEKGTPAGVAQKISKPIPYLTKTSNVILSHYEEASDLSIFAMRINDTENTTPNEKIEQLTELFGKNGLSLKVINMP